MEQTSNIVRKKIAIFFYKPKTDSCHNYYFRPKINHFRQHTIPEMTTYASRLIIVKTVRFKCLAITSTITIEIKASDRQIIVKSK